ALLPLLSDKALSLRQRTQLTTLVSLADPGSKEVAAALLAATGDGDQAVRTAAVEGLARLNPLPPEALAKLVAVAKTEARLRATALRALAIAGPQAKAARADIEAIAAGKQEDLALWAKVAHA